MEGSRRHRERGKEIDRKWVRERNILNIYFIIVIII